jgi:hypothetical protein
VTVPLVDQAGFAVSKSVESRIEKFICGGSVPTASLSIKRPPEN